jgi:hypothetical protein
LWSEPSLSHERTAAQNCSLLWRAFVGEKPEGIVLINLLVPNRRRSSNLLPRGYVCDQNRTERIGKVCSVRERRARTTADRGSPPALGQSGLGGLNQSESLQFWFRMLGLSLVFPNEANHSSERLNPLSGDWGIYFSSDSFCCLVTELFRLKGLNQLCGWLGNASKNDPLQRNEQYPFHPGISCCATLIP